METLFEDYSDKFTVVNDVIEEYKKSYTGQEYGNLKDRTNNDEFLYNQKNAIMNLCTLDEYKTMIGLKKNAKILQSTIDIKVVNSYESQVLSQLESFSKQSSNSAYENIAKTNLQSMKYDIEQIKFARRFHQEDSSHEASYLNPDQA